MNVDSGDPKPLATNVGYSFTFSTDGRGFVFDGGDARPPGLYSIRTDGTRERRLTEDTRPQVSPDFSPDGRRIVFVRVRGTTGFCCQGAVYVMDADGRNRRRLTGRMLDSRPAFSPDGRKIVFERFVEPGLAVLWTMNSDGTNRRPLRGGRVKGSAPTWQPLVGRAASR
jgi:TolB protein